MNKLNIDEKSFDTLLYISRIELVGAEKETLKKQISNIVSYFEELEKFKDEKILDDNYYSHSENDLRVASDKAYIDAHSLKVMNSEFMDGYFRTPKVLES